MWRWDIFCRVVDNYGDIGVCWRLARQLAAENDAKVRLWVDDLPSLARLGPEVSGEADEQRVEQIEVRRWQPEVEARRASERGEFPLACASGFDACEQVEAADVVIEAFGCELPDSYLAAMTRRKVAPVWINLEYLSAEAWVEDCHRLPSLRTRCPIDKYFFFPGFTSRTGGLLRERDLAAERDAFDAAAEAEFCRSVGVPPRRDNELRILMFCYANPALPELLAFWAAGPQPITVLATPGPASEHIAAWFGEPLVPGTPLRRSSLPGVFALILAASPQFYRFAQAVRYGLRNVAAKIAVRSRPTGLAARCGCGDW